MYGIRGEKGKIELDSDLVRHFLIYLPQEVQLQLEPQLPGEITRQLTAWVVGGAMKGRTPSYTYRWKHLSIRIHPSF